MVIIRGGQKWAGAGPKSYGRLVGRGRAGPKTFGAGPGRPIKFWAGPALNENQIENIDEIE